MWDSSEIVADNVRREVATLSPGGNPILDALFKPFKPSHATTNAMSHGGSISLRCVDRICCLKKQEPFVLFYHI